MEDPINFELDELIVRYELHPEFCDIFVEGEADQGLVSWFLQEQGRGNVSVYSIGAVSIPTDVIIGHGLEHPSNRSNVIALALELTANCTADIHVTCIADSDFEAITGIAKTDKLLFYTDYTSMEMYAYSPSVIDKLIWILTPRLKMTGHDLLNRINDVLQTFFILRLANQELMFGLAWIDTDKCTTIKDGHISFDLAEYSKRYLNTNGKLKNENAFIETTAAIRKKLRSDVRHQIRGRDFVNMLTWYLRKSAKSCRHLTPDTVRTLLFVQLTIEFLASESLFQVLLARTSGCA